jgi:flavin reductase (DIM6/NTAB) family NADH-FMN oxidoreductase RutF
VNASFKDAMSCVPNSVSVVAIKFGPEINACTISSLVSVDIENPKLLFVLKLDSGTLAQIQTGQIFSVILLSSSQESMAIEFASKLKDYSTPSWISGLDGALDLNGSRAQFVCKLDRTINEGGTAMVISSVLNYRFSLERDPLLYCDRKFIQLS